MTPKWVDLNFECKNYMEKSRVRNSSFDNFFRKSLSRKTASSVMSVLGKLFKVIWNNITRLEWDQDVWVGLISQEI